MKKATCVIILIFFPLFLTSSGGRRVMRDLLNIESYINERPDSALYALRQIDTLSLRTKAEKAKYSLLHAMALDKNYIDTTDTRIIMPAVEYYSRHGDADEKMRAYMYQGVALYNSGQFDEAIVAYSSALDFSEQVHDLNLTGLLHSKIADTYSVTLDYSNAEIYIDKAIDCFHSCKRIDQENLERIEKARNLICLMEWEKAEGYCKDLLNDTTFTPKQKGNIEGIYAMMILYSPNLSDSLALEHFNNALKIRGTLQDVDHYLAYAYVLALTGNKGESDTIFNQLSATHGVNGFSYNYWKHRLEKYNKDYKDAYYSLWAAKNYSDSVSYANFHNSVTKAHMKFLYRQAQESRQRSQNQIMTVWIIILLSFIIVLTGFFLYSNYRHRAIEEKGRMEIVIDSMKDQIEGLLIDNKAKDITIDKLARSNTKAFFSPLANLYETIIPYLNSGKESDKEKIYNILEKKVKRIYSDSSIHTLFEKDLNNNLDDIMIHFRKDFPDLSVDEYMMASYIFAGMDNTNIMFLMGITTLENTRVKKNRLKNKISNSTTKDKERYLAFWSR